MAASSSLVTLVYNLWQVYCVKPVLTLKVMLT